MLDPTGSFSPPPSWTDAPHAVLETATEALADGLAPAPLLLAYEGDEPLATIQLRPFDAGELGDVIIEALALLLPIGTDRIVLAVPGRAWSLQDPIPPVTSDVDLRAWVLVVSTADAHQQACRTTIAVHPFTADGDGLTDPIRTDEVPDAPALQAMQFLLDARHDVATNAGDLAVAAQLARVLLLGHVVALAPHAASRLELATTV